MTSRKSATTACPAKTSSQAPAGGRLRRPRVVAGRQQLAPISSSANIAASNIEARGHRELVTVIGHAAVISAGEWIIATGESNGEALAERARAIPKMEGADLVREVTCAVPYDWPAAGDDAHEDFRVPPERRAKKRLTIAAYDLGIKLKSCAGWSCTTATSVSGDGAGLDLLAASPDGIFLSNGPGDPAALPRRHRQREAPRCLEVPVFGICSTPGARPRDGRQHVQAEVRPPRGNHPVKNLATNKVEITFQNYGFAVDPESLPGHVRVTHLNLYDGTVEGLRHVDKRVFCVQYHPEASPGPHDADYLFRQFLDEIERN
jgi:carbamoyl-phosphate synthase small subunit